MMEIGGIRGLSVRRKTLGIELFTFAVLVILIIPLAGAHDEPIADAGDDIVVYDPVARASDKDAVCIVVCPISSCI